jgi:hypothetical protein
VVAACSWALGAAVAAGAIYLLVWASILPLGGGYVGVAQSIAYIADGLLVGGPAGLLAGLALWRRHRVKQSEDGDGPA